MTATLHTLLSVSLSNAIATTCLALAVIVVTRLYRSPALRHALWLLVLVKFVSPAFVKLATPDLSFAPATDVAPIPPQDTPESSVSLAARALDDRFAEAVTSSSEAAEGMPALVAALPGDAALWGTAADEATLGTLPALERGAAWAIPCALTAWGAGAALWFALVAVRLRRLERMLRGGDVAPAELRQEVERVAARCGLPRAPAVRVVNGTITPFVWAMWGRSILVVPQGLIDRLDTDERATLLAHELSHLCRRDHWVRWLELLVVGLYWWHPVAWFARRQLHCAGEQCCDARVVRTFPQQARAYAGALLKTIDYLADARATLPVAGTAFSQVNLLKRRFEMILQGKTFDRLPRTAAVIVMLSAAVVLPVSLGSLWAEEAPAVEEASASDPLDILESLVPEEAPAIREAGKGIAKSSVAAPAAGAPKTLDERLDRLEKLVESLASELHAKREEVAAPLAEAVKLQGATIKQNAQTLVPGQVLTTKDRHFNN